MLPLFTRRVALSAHLSTAAYLRIQPSSAPILRLRGVLDGGLPTCTAKSFANPRRNASTEVTATTNDADSPTISSKERKKLTHEWAAAQAEFLRAKKELGQKMKVLKRKETAGTNAALKAKSKARVQKEKEREKARAEKEKEREKARAEKEKEKEKARKEKARKVKKPILVKPPPRALGGFSLFVKEEKKVLGECHVEWQNLSAEKKQEYVARARAITEKRKEEFDAFVKALTPSELRRYNRHQRSSGGRAIRRVRPNGRPITGFFKLLQEFRARPDQAGRPTLEISRAAGVAWNLLTREEKDKYDAVPNESTAS